MRFNDEGYGDFAWTYNDGVRFPFEDRLQLYCMMNLLEPLRSPKVRRQPRSQSPKCFQIRANSIMPM